MKYRGHISTGQYEFIEFEVDGTASQVVEAYKELVKQWNEESELPAKEWNKWLDSYLAGKAGSVEEWEQMSFTQKQIIQEIKKSHARTKDK